LMRIIIGRVARKYGMRASLSPVPFAGSVGSGAHQHFSFTRDGVSVFSGGTGASGMRDEGASAVAGVLTGLREAQGVLSGSILSGLRMQPGHWSGAYACWGTENREAAVRFLPGGEANPYGANVEVKIVDPSANTYLASAAILGLALDGIEHDLTPPAGVDVDPSSLTDAERADAGVTVLDTDQTSILNALDGSVRLRRVLGDAVVDAVVAVRRYEQEKFAALSPEELAAKFRLAWSV
ncbi:glutamine synthetase, partial [Mycobacterium sp. ITM-2017-0098]